VLCITIAFSGKNLRVAASSGLWQPACLPAHEIKVNTGLSWLQGTPVPAFKVQALSTPRGHAGQMPSSHVDEQVSPNRTVPDKFGRAQAQQPPAQCPVPTGSPWRLVHDS